MMFRVASVEYLNSLPFSMALDALQQQGVVRWKREVPSACARLLLEGEVDMALLPVGSLGDFADLHLVSRYCIGSTGPVRTVKLFSEVPIDQVRWIELNPASRTSNLLVQLLCRHWWKLDEVVFLPGNRDDQPTGPGARLIIGDEAFVAEKMYPFGFDLCEAWMEWTQRPFAFAIWCARMPLDPALAGQIDRAFCQGIHLVRQLDDYPGNIDPDVLKEYFSINISYSFDEAKQMGIDRFLELCGIHNPLRRPVSIS
ncbi:MAG: menaquinone biosynthesis protein [Saprospiraceae bacterium]|nr:menaquinone biosynthesis protein [Saprospiraceae bacterium]